MRLESQVWDGYDAVPAMYRTVIDFYRADDTGQRGASPEADYGVHWRLTPWPEPWRVSYIQFTGEIYAVHQAIDWCSGRPRTMAFGPVLVLGLVFPDHYDVITRPGQPVFYATLDTVLEGWTEACGNGRPDADRDSLLWARDRILDADYEAIYRQQEGEK